MVRLTEPNATFDGIPGRGGAVIARRGGWASCKGSILFEEHLCKSVVEVLHGRFIHQFHGPVTSGEQEEVRTVRAIVTDFVTQEDGRPRVHFMTTQGLERVTP